VQGFHDADKAVVSLVAVANDHIVATFCFLGFGESLDCVGFVRQN
jgi:hypothetical protein